MAATAPLIAPFVSPEWFVEHRDEVRLVDCRWSLDGSQGREQYLTGHLPGAVHADLDTDLAASPSPDGGRHPLPAPVDFAAALRRRGIDDDTVVVAYDTMGGIVAARLAWMLRILDQPAAVLDDPRSLDGWDAETGEVEVEPGRATVRPWPTSALADLGEIEAVADGRGIGRVLVDARAADRHRGQTEPVDPRPGRIPGSVNVPVSGLVANGRLLDAEELRERFTGVGLDTAGRDVVWSCGSGVTACHGALAMEQAGFARPRVFVGSYSAWSSDPARPVERG